MFFRTVMIDHDYLNINIQETSARATSKVVALLGRHSIPLFNQIQEWVLGILLGSETKHSQSF
jgi:hypothetical protein